MSSTSLFGTEYMLVLILAVEKIVVEEMPVKTCLHQSDQKEGSVTRRSSVILRTTAPPHLKQLLGSMLMLR